jgi:hypothetical protein
MTRKQSTKKGSARGKAPGIKNQLTPAQTAEIEAEAETFKQAAHDYATKAYSAALAHFEQYHDDPFALSRLPVVYGETKPGDFHMVVTLSGERRDRATSDEDIRRWIADAEMIARTLEDQECSEAYRKAFSGIYTDHLLGISRVDWETPAAVRVLLPLAMIDLSGNRPADADTTQEILAITLRSALLSDEVSERTRTVNG